MRYKVNILINQDNFGYYAYCPELPGCHSQGDSFEEVLANIKEAVDLYIETMSPEEIHESLHKKTFSTSLEVQIA